MVAASPLTAADETPTVLLAARSSSSRLASSWAIRSLARTLVRTRLSSNCEERPLEN